MNVGRVVAAGLVAGLVLNMGEAALHVAVFGDATARAIQAAGGTLTDGVANTSLLIGLTFVQGLVAMVLYGAVQPTWKAGVATAIRIGLALWVLSGVYSAVYLSAGFSGVIPDGLAWGPVAFELVLYPLAVIAGSWIQRSREM